MAEYQGRDGFSTPGLTALFSARRVPGAARRNGICGPDEPQRAAFMLLPEARRRIQAVDGAQAPRQYVVPVSSLGRFPGRSAGM